jgi:hypothetical protein
MVLGPSMPGQATQPLPRVGIGVRSVGARAGVALAGCTRSSSRASRELLVAQLSQSICPCNFPSDALRGQDGPRPDREPQALGLTGAALGAQLPTTPRSASTSAWSFSRPSACLYWRTWRSVATRSPREPSTVEGLVGHEEAVTPLLRSGARSVGANRPWLDSGVHGWPAGDVHAGFFLELYQRGSCS